MYIFSPARSGGTLIQNIIEHIFHQQCERHVQVQRPEYSYSVIVYRDFRDVILSRIRVCGDKFTKKNIRCAFDYMKPQFEDLNKFTHYLDASPKDRPLFLKYENFYENFEYICNQITIKFQIDLKPDVIEITNKFNVSKTKEFTDNLGNFNIVDQASGLHGDHIGSQLGLPKSYEYASEIQQKYLTELAKPYLEIWYDI